MPSEYPYVTLCRAGVDGMFAIGTFLPSRYVRYSDAIGVTADIAFAKVTP